MKMYAEREGYVAATTIALFKRLCADLEAMPDLNPSELVTCHVVCRALARRHAGVRYVDGHFGGRGNEHSWLVLSSGQVADMYPIAGCVPFLVDLEPLRLNPWSRLYVEDEALLGKRVQQTDETVDHLLALMAPPPETLS